ncbi:MAG: hypothetical protein ABI986_06505 [Chloroflexota bacterium]
MKRFIRPAILLFISLFLVLVSVAFSHSNYVQSGNIRAALFFQTTPTPHQQVDQSEVGSTDGITIMSFVIVVIIIIPIYLQRRHWSQK